MADVTGQIQRRPGVCVSTLGPGAVNMTLGVANAFLDRSPVVAITATLARADREQILLRPTARTRCSRRTTGRAPCGTS